MAMVVIVGNMICDEERGERIDPRDGKVEIRDSGNRALTIDGEDMRIDFNLAL